MHDLPRQKLAELLAKYGHGFFDDEKRLEAMLKDLLRNEHKRETFVLMSALREGVAQDLRAPTSGMPLAAVTAKLIRQLRDNLALDESAARWGVESWAVALELRMDPMPFPLISPASTAPVVPAKFSTKEINNDFVVVKETIQSFGSSKYIMQQVPTERVAVWRELAECGDLTAQWLLGDWYCECNDGRPDFSAAELWWTRAANGGLAHAYSTLGWLCQNGRSANFEKDQAIDWFRRGEAAQDATATHRLATCFLNGSGVEMDQTRAVKLLERSAKLGYLASFVTLARCFQQGIGVNEDKLRATTLLQQAAESGSRQAQYFFGLDCLEATSDVGGRDIAIEWLNESARRGYRGAMAKLEELGQFSHRVAQINSDGIEFCLLEPGTFQMGTKNIRRLGHREFADELPLHPVTLCQPFWIGRYTVTQEQYRAITGKNPSKFKGLWPRKWKRRPVETVSWIEALRFCNALSEREGRVPAYEFRGDSVNWVGGTGYRLPTEAEWEYACRSGSQSDWSWGDDADDSPEHAWCRPHYSDDGGKTVGELCCNKNGLFDMHGNVWEWCWDYYDQTYYSRSPALDPTGPDQGEKHALRGGSWDMLPINCRSAIRVGNLPHEKFDDVGFRIVRSENRDSVLWLPAVFRERGCSLLR